MGSAIKYLVDHKKEALPALIAQSMWNSEITHEQIGICSAGARIPRAVPALIRALPRTLQPGRSDYGLILENEAICKFMQLHDQIGSTRPGSISLIMAERFVK